MWYTTMMVVVSFYEVGTGYYNKTNEKREINLAENLTRCTIQEGYSFKLIRNVKRIL